MPDSRFNQIAGGMPQEAKHRCIVDMIHGDQLNIVHLANGPPSLKEGFDRYEKELPLLLFVLLTL